MNVGARVHNCPMATDTLDAALIRRIVRRVAPLVEGGAVRSELLDECFGLFHADTQHRAAVRAALQEIGVRISADPHGAGAGVGNQPLARSTGLVMGEAARLRASRLASRSGFRKPAPPRSMEELAIEAARRVMDDDRFLDRPEKRMLTTQEERGLSLIMRPAGHALSEELPKGYRAALEAEDERARAFDAMVLHNQGLVHHNAKSAAGRMEYEDLVQSAQDGLRRAVEKFDASMSLKFSTYATHWINQALSRAIANESRLIRVPVHMHEKVEKVMAVRSRLIARVGYASLFDLSVETGLRPDEVLTCLRLAVGVISLSTLVGDDGDAELDDFVPANQSEDPESVVLQDESRHQVHDVVASLPSREAEVIRLRFGLDDDVEHTLDQIGRHFGLTRERIRQIEVKAKEKLRAAL